MSATNTNASVSLAEATDIRDIAPPLEIPGEFAWLWWVVGAAVLITTVVALLIYLRTRRQQVIAPIVIPPHIRAKQKLQDALALIAQPKPFVIAVSDTARWYLEERFKFHAPERTTEEFLHELQRTDLLTRDQKDSLGGFLASCDLVKFARYEPGEAELRELHASAVRLVEETEPVAVAPGNTQMPVADRQSKIVNRKS
jgi:hypothetical protein